MDTGLSQAATPDLTVLPRLSTSELASLAALLISLAMHRRLSAHGFWYMRLVAAVLVAREGIV
jgi:hypothetical protein